MAVRERRAVEDASTLHVGCPELAEVRLVSPAHGLRLHAMTHVPTRELALHLARLLDDKGGHDVLLLALPPSALVDFALLVTGRSDRQVKALTDEALHFCKRLRISHFPPEGETGWALLDCGDVVVHALSEEMRQFYRLERLWPEAKAVQWQSEAASLARIDLPAPAIA